ncbi:hypothetical protein [Niveibacterium sp. SC-1]|uniref:hypothetical protein n=1 Tax=Niveibacterium sp. SC-1 TaxID=3135646 RepID=UPI00311F023F
MSRRTHLTRAASLRPIFAIALLASASLALYTGSPGAAEVAWQPPPSFAQLDTNKDGLLDAAEIAAFPPLAEFTSRVDADKDGRLSPAEYAAALQAMKTG